MLRETVSPGAESWVADAPPLGPWLHVHAPGPRALSPRLLSPGHLVPFAAVVAPVVAAVFSAAAAAVLAAVPAWMVVTAQRAVRSFQPRTHWTPSHCAGLLHVGGSSAGAVENAPERLAAGGNLFQK